MILVALGVLWGLGSLLMVDNIRAQPHEEYRPGYGFVLVALIIGWPLAVVYSLIAGVVVKDRP